MKNRAYGLVGVGAKMANWNADFDGNPKKDSEERVFGSDKAIKYSIRKYWVNNAEKVLMFKRMSADKKTGKAKPNGVLQNFELVTGIEVKKDLKETEVLDQLFQILDTQNFGVSFLAKPFNLSVSGAVQFSQGFNILEESQVHTQDILSPFPSSEDKDQSSIGKMTLLEESHYIYPFTVNPKNYEAFEEIVGRKDLYTQEAYDKFKEGALKGATALNTVVKTGCYNEFGLFIQLKEESKLYLPPIDNLLSFDQEEQEYDFSKISELVAKFKDEIEVAELYLNDFKVTAVGTENLEVKSIYSI